MDTFDDDVVEILEMREQQLTDMIRMLQKKRRNVREFITRYSAQNLKPVPDSVPVAESAVAKAEEISGGINQVCWCREEGLRFHKESCPLRVG